MMLFVSFFLLSRGDLVKKNLHWYYEVVVELQPLEVVGVRLPRAVA